MRAWMSLGLVASLCVACGDDDDNLGGDDADATVDEDGSDGVPSVDTADAGTDGGPDDSEGSDLPALDTLDEGWTKLEPGGDTSCARGDDFHFFARPGTVNKLVLFFDGGGACWDRATCGFGDALFDSTADESLPDPGEGVADYDDPQNPFADWHAVFIPYCTGDIHWGDSDTTYPGEGGQQDVVIRHRGQVNTTAVLDWVYAQFEEPETIFVTGVSAGAYGAAGWAPHVIEQYPDSFVVQLGDSGAGVITETFFEDSFPSWNADAIIPDWIDELDVPISELALEKLYIALANHYPQHVFSQFNTDTDETQILFYVAMGGDPNDWSGEMRAKINAIIDDAPDFRSYIAGGNQHGVLPYPEFFSYATGGTSLRDWVADLVDGKDVDNVECEDCAEPELAE